MEYNKFRIFLCMWAVLCVLARIHGQILLIKQASAALRLYHMTTTDSLCQMSLATNSVSFRRQTVLRYTHSKGSDTGARSHKHTE